MRTGMCELIMSSRGGYETCNQLEPVNCDLMTTEC